ncbi:MAG: adenosylcobinamide-GDP ribazoletransferase [Planctomycetes bacterium]|nr:adenosylcobinamide-GDP ribazoletransferase [Planctomycetota bacterium]
MSPAFCKSSLFYSYLTKGFGILKDFVWTLQFLTAVPIAKSQRRRIPKISNIAFWFPIVGICIGIVLTGFYLLVLQLFPDLIADAIILIVYIAMTGGFHLDGFADSCDGLLGGNNRESRLEIMRDSRVGAYGVICLIVTIGLKYLCLVSIDPKSMVGISLFFDQDVMGRISPVLLSAFEKGKILLFMCVVGRWSQILCASISTYARDDAGTGQIIVETLNLKHLLFSSLVPGILVFFFCGLKSIYVLFIVLIVCIMFTSYVKGKIGGMTGDTLGAANEISELIVLLTFLTI